jgi:predicted transcriptional regulator
MKGRKMVKSIVEMTSDIVSSNCAGRGMSISDISEQLEAISNTLSNLSTKGDTKDLLQEIKPEKVKPMITQHDVGCLECGNRYKLISNRHLQRHGMTMNEYRNKYGILRGVPLSAKSLSAKRRKIAKDLKLGQKLVAYRTKIRQQKARV